ncbi:hydrophobic surface binding protein A-domain-containing protein [Cadophora sp. MPI-SDFR-AT-0126]|nr:hydrophobic surface binding protein A-domain-containing protein [Leotiomycetes sp. MPI-SDFR-AT-0126]
MLAIKYLLFFISVALALVSKRDFGVIVNDLVIIDNKVKSLTTTIQNWSSANGLGILGAAPILTASQALESTTRTATTHATQSPQLTEEQSNSMGILINTLKTDTSALLVAMKSKKTDFANVGALSIARNSITSLTTAQDAYSTALINITPDINKPKGEQDKADFDAFFADAAKYYSS